MMSALTHPASKFSKQVSGVILFYVCHILEYN